MHGYLTSLPGISRIHDLHSWAMDIATEL